jgi:hypothetical protein
VISARRELVEACQTISPLSTGHEDHDPDHRQDTVRSVSKLMSPLLVEIMTPLYAEHPDLKPPELM